jgi:hypothetical protein
MAGLVPATHVLPEGVDARDKPAHDGLMRPYDLHNGIG